VPQAPGRRATSESSDVANLVRLHHRRRGWARVAVGSVIGLVVYAGIAAAKPADASEKTCEGSLG
jgi:hypothetical protein